MTTENFVTKAMVAVTTASLGSAVEALVGLALSVKHCRDKCKALADKVKEIHDFALSHIQQERHHFEEADLGRALAKFEQVVKDATDLVRRYKNRSIWIKLLLALKLDDDFDSLDSRLSTCTSLFHLSLQVQSSLSLAHVQKSQDAHMQDIQEQYSALQREVQDMKRLVSSPPDCDHAGIELCQDLAKVIHVGEELYGGYMIAARMQQDQDQQEHVLDVLLIASAQLDLKQFAIMKRLSSHANILQFFGKHVADGGCLYAVMERPGSTSSIMTLDILISNHPTLDCDWRLKKMIVLELALAIAYAHSAGVLHRGLRSPNIFLTDDFHPKIFGFFQGRIKAEPSEKRFSSLQQFRWAAPEMLQKKRPEYNEMCDIFSFGVIMWELITWSYPYSDCSKEQDVITARTKKGRKLEFPLWDSCSYILKEFLHICLECMEFDPCKRPSIVSIVDRISKLAPEDMHMASKLAPEDIMTE